MQAAIVIGLCALTMYLSTLMGSSFLWWLAAIVLGLYLGVIALMLAYMLFVLILAAVVVASSK